MTFGASGELQAPPPKLIPQSDAVVIVDVLSFSTAVDIAVGNWASVYPYQFHGDSAEAYARTLGAVCAESQRGSGYSLVSCFVGDHSCGCPPGAALTERCHPVVGNRGATDVYGMLEKCPSRGSGVARDRPEDQRDPCG